MTHNIAKIRAALELARHAAEFCALPGLAAKTDEALAALAELERAAAEPVAWMWNDMLGISHTYVSSKRPTWPDAGASPEMEMAINVRPLYAAPPAQVAAAPQFVAGEVTEEMCQRVAASFYGADTFANGVEMHEALQLWRKELGPALGLVEIREPSDDECIAINEHVLRAHGIEGCGAVLNGRVIFDAVAKWLKGEL